MSSTISHQNLAKETSQERDRVSTRRKIERYWGSIRLLQFRVRFVVPRVSLIPLDVEAIVEADEYKLLRMAGCLYCRFCGQLVSEPYICSLHELENCPIYSWYESGQCQTFVSLYVLSRGGVRVPDQVLLDATR